MPDNAFLRTGGRRDQFGARPLPEKLVRAMAPRDELPLTIQHADHPPCLVRRHECGLAPMVDGERLGEHQREGAGTGTYIVVMSFRVTGPMIRSDT